MKRKGEKKSLEAKVGGGEGELRKGGKLRRGGELKKDGSEKNQQQHENNKKKSLKCSRGKLEH